MRWLTRFSSSSWWPDTGCGSISPDATFASSDASDSRAVEDGPAERAVPARVALLERLREGPALEEVGRDEQRPGERVDAADVGVEQVGPVRALAAQLGVEVEAAGREPAAPQDLVERQGQVLDRVRELVGVPAVLRVAAVRVDAAEHPVRDGVRDLVVERVAGERRVVRLDVEPVLVLEPVADEEAVDRRRVVVVLVLGRLHRLRLDQERALEPDPVLVLGDEVQEAGELVALALEVGVEQRVVALAAAPQHVVRATETLA